MKRLTVLAAALVLSACGGGGGDETTSTPSTTTASAEGFWNGTTTTGTEVSLAVLENGETWGLYASSDSVVGALYGNTTTSGTTLSGSGTGFNFVTRTSSSGSYTGNVTTKAAITLDVSDGTKFSGTYDASYDQAASLSSLAGTYTGWAVTAATAAQTTTVAVDAGGNISSSFIDGLLNCTTTGTATPRASGKNIFNLQLTFTGNNCALGNGTVVTGVATYDSVDQALIAMGLNSARSDGLVFVGTR